MAKLKLTEQFDDQVQPDRRWGFRILDLVHSFSRMFGQLPDYRVEIESARPLELVCPPDQVEGDDVALRPIPAGEYLVAKIEGGTFLHQSSIPRLVSDRLSGDVVRVRLKCIRRITVEFDSSGEGESLFLLSAADTDPPVADAVKAALIRDWDHAAFDNGGD